MPQFRDNFHSEEAQEIMGRAPSWVVRWGITVIFVILALIVLGCYIIKYPQTVTAPISITTVNAPPTSRPVTTDCSTAYVSATGRTSVPVSLSLCSRHRPTTTTSGRWKKISPPPIRRKHSPRPTGCPTDMFWATCKPRGRSSPPAASILGIIWPPISSERRSACSQPKLRKTSAIMPNWRHRANCSTRTLLWGSGHWSGLAVVLSIGYFCGRLRNFRTELSRQTEQQGRLRCNTDLHGTLHPANRTTVSGTRRAA